MGFHWWKWSIENLAAFRLTFCSKSHWVDCSWYNHSFWLRSVVNEAVCSLKEGSTMEVLFAHRAVVKDYPLFWHLNVVLRNRIRRNTNLCLLHYVILSCYVQWVSCWLSSATTEVDLNESLVVWKDLDYLQRGKKDNFLNRNNISVPSVRYNLAPCSRSR